jgi:hypothetical protein
MKKLKFANPDSIMEGRKNTTWRINDEKNLSVGDILSLSDIKGDEFAKARIVDVRETVFEGLKKEDMEGHEEFSSSKVMYQTYSKYYKMKVTPRTEVKVIKFQVLR